MALGNYTFSIDHKHNSHEYVFDENNKIVVDMHMKMAYKLHRNSPDEAWSTKDQFSIDGLLLETWHQILLNFEKALCLCPA